MSDRQNVSRPIALVLVLAVVSVFALATFGGRLTSLLSSQSSFAESVTSESAASAALTLGVCDTAGPIEVESSGGTTTPTAYPTLKGAFDAIIAGTHTGSINIEVCGNTTETATAALTASGVGSASYTDVTIRPVGGSRIIEGAITGAVVRLQGADGVTIDGRQGGMGTGRDLTVRNTSTAAATAAIWLSSVAAGNGASNNVVRNLEVAAGQTANVGTNTTIGIFMGPSTISLSGTDGNDNDNNQFLFNRITKARYGIATRGVTSNNHEGLVIADNVIGPNSFGADEIGKAGIFLQADTGAVVTRNTVQFVGGDLANTTAGADRCGICIGGESWSATESTTITSGGYQVTKNVVHDIVEERAFSAMGIRIGTTRSGVATGNVVANNFIYNVRSDGTGGDQPVGIGYANGHTDVIAFNSISMTGDMDPGSATSGSTYGNAIRVTQANGSNNANLTLMNNSIYLDVNANTAAQRYYAITLNSNAYVFGTGGLNHNNYYINAANTQLQTGGLGTGTGNAATTQFATLANWQAALTAPQDANSIQADPLYFSTTSDIHIQTASPNVNAGLAIAGITDDIDAQMRPNGPSPDIGADEFYASPGSVQFSMAAYSVTEAGITATITATRTGGANGAVSIDYATVAGGTATGGATCGGAVDYENESGTLNWGDLDSVSKTFQVTVCSDGALEPSETVNLALSNPGGGVTLGTPNAAVLTILNSTIFGSTISVGTGEGTTSLTNPGGLFEQINNGVLTANLAVSVTSDLTAESGNIALNHFGGGFTVTIQPSGGAARLISGGNGTVLLDFNGADGVTIDGLNTGGNSLTIRNTAAGTGTAVRFINDASNNTVANSTLEGGGTSAVLQIATGATTGNDNYQIVGNTIRDRSDAVSIPFNSINLIGTSAAIANGNITINNNQIFNFAQAGIVIGGSENITFTNNTIFQTAARTTSIFGVAVNSAFGVNLFSQNTIRDLTTSLNTTGMQFNDARATTVSRNLIYNFPSTSGSTGVLTGLLSNGVSAAPADVTLVNNSVIITPAFTNAQNIFGIRDFGFAGNTFNAYYNSILISGTGSGTANTWACQRGFSAPTTFTALNNLCFNNRTGGTGNHFAGGDQSSNTGTFVSNHNLFVGTGATAANMFDKATSSTAVPVNFASWQAGPPTRDANSQSSNPGVGNYTVANMFVSATDLHLANEMTNPASNAGTPVMGVTTDFDNNARSGSTPEIGFDEFAGAAGTLAFSSATYLVGEGAVMATITVNRTGGTAGAVTVDYFTGAIVASGFPATGGASCATPGVDYVTTNGTLNFSDGEASDSFDVTICEDSIFEGSEDFPVNLTNATGGATIGSPSSAVVTITDNETTPTVQFSSATYSTAEGLAESGIGNAATITVTLSGPSAFPSSVNYATSDGTATGGGSCTAGIDYVTSSGTLNFAAGDVSETFQVQICPDATTEGDETVNLALSSPSGVTLGTPNTAVLTITDDDAPASPVTVTATAGTTGPTPYNTLKEAVDAINAGTHQGSITVSINANTTEAAAPIVLHSSGAGPASYTAILIRPTINSATVAGVTTTGRGLLELNGADNVTIDGDNPNSGGTNRNLTFQNTAANTVTFTSVIRVALATTVVNTADGNTFRNLNIVGSSTGRNIASATLTTGSENTTFGIFAGPGASTAAATNPPAAIASVITGVAAGATASNLTVTNNSIVTAARGVSINGSATSVFPGLVINNNSVGNPVAADPDQVTAVGITAQGSTNAIISGNTVWVEGFVPSSAATHGINVGVNSALITGATIDSNKVNRARNNNPSTWSAMGINLGGGSSHRVQNNFVSGVINNQTAGTGAFGTTFGSYGIRVASGTGHFIYHNSVHLYGALPGVVSTDLTAAFMIVGTGQTGVDVRNNIFSNRISGGNPTGTRHASVYLPSGATSTMNLTLNNNAYFGGTDANSRLAQVGTAFGAGEFHVGDFDPTATTPASNLRAYTSTLSAAGTNDNASFATSSPPPFVSDVDLHIPAATATRLESGGADVDVNVDIDTESRHATTPDIGADEFVGAPPPANDMAAAAFLVPVNGSTIQTGSMFSPQARFTNNGTAVQTSVTVRFRIIDSTMTTIYNQTAVIPTINPLQVVTVTFPSTSIAMPGSYSMIASVELAGDADPANDSINGTFNAVDPMGGTVTVGAGGDFTSLTNPGGLFQALNIAGLSSSLTVNITSDLTAETGAVGLNQLSEAGPGGYTVTIKPSGAARVISGTAPTSTGLINLNGADRIIFDGSLSGGSDRSLTITNNQTGTSTVVWMKSIGSNGSTSNTIKNCIINGAVGTIASTTAGILTGSGVTIGNDAEAANSNNTIQNNWIYRVQNSMYLRGGATAPNFDQNWVVTGNEMGSVTSTADKNIFRGMLIGNSANFTVTGNTVHGVQSSGTTTAAMSGIQLALLLSNGTVTNNRIHDIKSISATGTGAHGISIIATSTNSNVTIANNFVWDIAAPGSATLNANGHGIAFLSLAPGGSGYKLYHNSVNLNTNQTNAQTSAALFIVSTFNVAGAIDARNNIFANTQTTGNRFAVHSSAPATIFSTINNNDYFAPIVGFIGGSNRVTLADWQTATGQDANSNAVDPLFVSPTDLHLQPGSPMLASGATGTGITTDIDGDTRDAVPDIGADEIVTVGNPGTLAFSSATYSIAEGGGSLTVTVNRTGGSDGTVGATYAMTNGTATGGASCGGSVDFVNTGGTVTLVGGQTSTTFNVPICQDPTDEPDETFNLALSNPTGGAVIGSPSSAVATILDDDAPVLGTFSINDVRSFEGNAGALNFQFTVSYTGPVQPASVQFATSNGTAVSGVDYLPASGTLNFNQPGPEGLPAPQTQIVNVVVNSDVVKEANETFFVTLSSPTGGTISDDRGVGIIIDEDRAYVADFDRDLETDVSVFRPSDGTWYVRESTSKAAAVVPFGLNGDVPVPGDYDGDGLADYAVWRPSTGVWHRILSSTSSVASTAWGAGTDLPVQGDYDGDGKTDLAIFRPSSGEWWVLRSSTGTSAATVFGQSGDRPVQGDYDGDARTDLAVFRNGTWHIARSSSTVLSVVWGIASDLPVSGDFDGDGSHDLAVYRSGVWWIYQSLTGTVQAVNWGNATDVPSPGDYDGDGTTDVMIFRPSNGNWIGLRSSNGSTYGLIWGLSGDVSIPASYVHP